MSDSARKSAYLHGDAEILALALGAVERAIRAVEHLRGRILTADLGDAAGDGHAHRRAAESEGKRLDRAAQSVRHRERRTGPEAHREDDEFLAPDACDEILRAQPGDKAVGDR